MEISIRLMQQGDLPKADRVFRLAFGSFIGLPDPTQFCGDANFIQHRWQTEPTGAFAATKDGEIIGSNLATRWGSVGFFGPLSVHPDFWNQKIAQRLIEPIVEWFTEWNIQQAGLLTFPNSPKHHALYQKFGFWPRFLTAIMAKSVQQPEPVLQGVRYSQLSEDRRSEFLRASFELTNGIYEGLDLSQEIRAVNAQQLGDAVGFWDEKNLVGFAVCHYGAGTEAGSNTCYVKFGAVRSGKGAEQRFEQLLDLCETLSATQGMSRLVAGVNTSRQEAYRCLIARGFRTEITGVAMHRPNEAAYNRPDIFALDDWR